MSKPITVKYDGKVTWLDYEEWKFQKYFMGHLAFGGKMSQEAWEAEEKRKLKLNML